MAATAASSFFPLSSSPSSKTSRNGGPDSVDTRAMKPSTSSSGGLRVKASVRATPKINGTKVGIECPKDEDYVQSTSPAPRTFINQLPDWSMLLAAITTIFLAAEKQWTNLDWDWKPKRPDMLVDPFGFGRMVQDGQIFQQNFLIRSYEIGADRTASIETLMNHLQETALNHVRGAGLQGEGFGSTPAMSKRDLIWVVAKMQVVVDCYPSWGDIVQVDTWVTASGKNGMRRDWLVRDGNTGQILTRATSLWVMMNKKTRRLSKIPEEARGEIEPYFANFPAIVEEDSRKLPKLDDNTAEFVRKGLTPRWGDLDVNQHVNNIKYVGWILESTPRTILETHELTGVTLEYRRECSKDSVLQSLTAVSGGCNSLDGESSDGVAGMECDHLLRLESGEEILRATTQWSPKRMNLNSVDHLPAERRLSRG